MKSSPIDYLLSTLALTAIGGLCWLVVAMAGRHLFSHLAAYEPVAGALGFLLIFGLISALCARILLRVQPLGEGVIGMDDKRFVVWKLYTVLYEFGCGALKPFTVMFLRPVVQQLFGARIGKDVALGGKLVDPHMIELGAEAIIGEGSVVTAHAINSGSIFLAPVVIERSATIGVGAVVYPDVVVGEGAIVAANAVVRSGTRIPPGEFWGGVPACRLREKPSPG
jgi:acetyltransferase-like isoleucine patch superfamily enzyme